MGREIRMVPPNWEHPKKENGEYMSMYDKDYDTAAQEWLDGLVKWNEKPEKEKYSCKYFWEYEGNPPNKELYRPKFTEPATWYQVYQTVSEGYPVTPPFATTEELVDYLVEHGDFWDQKRGHGGYSREAAEAFVNSGWAPSFVFNPQEGVMGGIEAAGKK